MDLCEAPREYRVLGEAFLAKDIGYAKALFCLVRAAEDEAGAVSPGSGRGSGVMLMWVTGALGLLPRPGTQATCKERAYFQASAQGGLGTGGSGVEQ